MMPASISSVAMVWTRFDRDRLAEISSNVWLAEPDVGTDELGALVVPRSARSLTVSWSRSHDASLAFALRSHAIALIGRHCTVDALGLEVARGRGEKQRAVIVQTLRADETRS